MDHRKNKDLTLGLIQMQLLEVLLPLLLQYVFLMQLKENALCPWEFKVYNKVHTAEAAASPAAATACG